MFEDILNDTIDKLNELEKENKGAQVVDEGLMINLEAKLNSYARKYKIESMQASYPNRVAFNKYQKELDIVGVFPR